MLLRSIQRFLANPRKRIHVVIGGQYQKFEEPSYSTDPRDYDFELGEYQTTSPSEFAPLPWESPAGASATSFPTIMKAFRIASDAIDFAYCCNLDSVSAVTYERTSKGWEPMADQSAFDIDW